MSRLAAATIDFLMLIESHFAKSARAGLLVSAVRLRVISSHNREVGHVPAYSYSNRWVGVGRACSDAWIVAGEIRRGKGNRHYRPRKPRHLVVICRKRDSGSIRQIYRANQETRCERAGPRGQRGQAGRCALRYDSGGRRSTL